MVCVCIMDVDVGECGWGGLVSGVVCACVWVGRGVCWFAFMGVDMGGCVLVHEWIWVAVCGFLFLICKT
jgi:hypothetical protein